MELTWEGEPKTMTQCHALTVGNQQISLARRKCDMPRIQNSAGSASARSTADTQLLAKLHYHLQQLSPQRRRELIAEQLTQTQRLALEQWMLHRGAECLGRKISQIASLRCCGRRGRANHCHHTSALRRSAIRNNGYRICLSLDFNFYVQSGLCKNSDDAARALNMLMRLRKVWQQLASQGNLKLGFVLSVNALRQSSRSCAREADGLRFRTQLSFGRGHRLSSPLRRDPAEAFEDWRRLTTAWKHSLFTGAQLRSKYSPDLVEKQWSHSCRVWRDIWIRSGRCPHDLERSLKAKEAALGPRWAQAKAKWHRLQAQISGKIRTLLDSWSQRRAGKCSKELITLRSNARFRIPLKRNKRGVACLSEHGIGFAHSKRPLKASRKS